MGEIIGNALLKSVERRKSNPHFQMRRVLSVGCKCTLQEGSV